MGCLSYATSLLKLGHIVPVLSLGCFRAESRLFITAHAMVVSAAVNTPTKNSSGESTGVIIVIVLFNGPAACVLQPIAWIRMRSRCYSF